MKRNIVLKISIIAAAVFALLASCSSQPKNSGDIYEMRSLAEKDLSVANREAGRGNYETALLLLNECRRKAILTDDYALIVRCCLSRGNVLFTLNNNDEAFKDWEEAIALAKESSNIELLSVSKIYNARGKLLSGIMPAEAVLNEVNAESGNIKTDKLYIAFSWQVKGLALRELKSFTEAEAAIKHSLDIHEKDKSLENAAYDWYTIASIRSLAGNSNGALQALEAAIAIDRRIENSWGIAACWRAMGDVYRKTGNHLEAAQAYTRAKNIYTAMGNDKEAAETEKRMEN